MNRLRKELIIVSSILLCLLVPKVLVSANHLEPIAPYDSMGDGYHQAVFTSLIGKGSASLWMIEMPSHHYREYAVMLWCEWVPDPNNTAPARYRAEIPGQWFVGYVTPKEKIWRYKTTSDGHRVLDIKPTEDVERHRIRVPKDFAKVLKEAWLNTLELTRYGEDRTGPVIDGTNWQFYCGGFFGEVQVPGPLPAMLVDLGRKLRALALSDEKGKEPLLADADSLARRIAKDAEAEQIKLFGKKMSLITWSSILDRKK